MMRIIIRSTMSYIYIRINSLACILWTKSISETNTTISETHTSHKKILTENQKLKRKPNPYIYIYLPIYVPQNTVGSVRLGPDGAAHASVVRCSRGPFRAVQLQPALQDGPDDILDVDVGAQEGAERGAVAAEVPPRRRGQHQDGGQEERRQR